MFIYFLPTKRKTDFSLETPTRRRVKKTSVSLDIALGPNIETRTSLRLLRHLQINGRPRWRYATCSPGYFLTSRPTFWRHSPVSAYLPLLSLFLFLSFFVRISRVSYHLSHFRIRWPERVFYSYLSRYFGSPIRCVRAWYKKTTSLVKAFEYESQPTWNIDRRRLRHLTYFWTLMILC